MHQRKEKKTWYDYLLDFTQKIEGTWTNRENRTKITRVKEGDSLYRRSINAHEEKHKQKIPNFSQYIIYIKGIEPRR